MRTYQNNGVQSVAVANRFTLLSVLALLFNFVSQIAAFPLQTAMIIYGVQKSDVKFLPGLFILLLDKSCFTIFDVKLIKFNIGISLGTQNILLIAVFFIVIINLLRNRFDRKTSSIIIFWLTSVIPAIIIAFIARRQSLTDWQQPMVDFLTPALYFWGITMAPTWEFGKENFIKQLTLLYTPILILSFFRQFYVFSFAIYTIPVALFFAVHKMKLGFMWTVISFVGMMFCLSCVVFSRYVAVQERTGMASSVDVGSTFTTISTTLFCVLIIVIAKIHSSGGALIRRLPIPILLILCSIFFYAVNRAGSNKNSDQVSNEIQTLSERFEYKLIGDRGTIWNEGIRDIFEPPYVFRDMGRQMVLCKDPVSGGFKYGMKIPPHNQILTLLVHEGWWLGSVCIILMFIMHFRMYRAASVMCFDSALMYVLVAASSAVFYAVGLTGQSVWTAQFTGNGMATMVFPGIAYGAFLIMRRRLENESFMD